MPVSLPVANPNLINISEVTPLSPTSDKPLIRKPVLRKRYTRTKIYHRTNRSLSRCNSIIEQTEDIDSSAEFWDRNFREEKCVQWERLV